MKGLRTLAGVLLAWTNLTYAQPPEGHGENLVPNHDFEALVGRRPESDVDGSGVFRHNMVAWKSPTMSTPDVKISLPTEVKRAKRMGIDIDQARSGYKMVAILTHNPDSRRSDTYREYIQGMPRARVHVLLLQHLCGFVADHVARGWLAAIDQCDPRLQSRWVDQ